jgi:hypothetical protein
MTMRHESADRIRELLDRNLQEVFGEGDASRRRGAIDALWREDAILYTPSGAIAGRAAIDGFAGSLRATHPDYVYTPHGNPQILGNAGRLAWGSGPAGEAPVYTGWDVIIVRDGMIDALYVFLDETSDEYRHAASGTISPRQNRIRTPTKPFRP